MPKNEILLPFYFSADAKQVGQYSRRHLTRDAQDNARQAYQREHGRNARRRRAAERAAA